MLSHFVALAVAVITLGLFYSIQAATAFTIMAVLSKFSQTVEYYFRLTLYVTGMGATAFYGIFASIACALVGKRSNAQWVVARTFYNVVGPLIGWKFKIEGAEHLQLSAASPAVVVGNHQTLIDIMYLGATFPKHCSVMSKKELKWTPFLGQFMLLANAIFVDRANRKSALSTFGKVAQTMKRKGVSLFVFAEGTRHPSKEPTLLPFKKGAFHLAVEGQVPIIPLVCENYHRLYCAKEKRFKSGEVAIKVLAPISTVGLTSSSADIAALAAKTREAMLDALEEMANRENSASGSKTVERDAPPAVAAAASG